MKAADLELVTLQTIEDVTARVNEARQAGHVAGGDAGGAPRGDRRDRKGRRRRRPGSKPKS